MTKESKAQQGRVKGMARRKFIAGNWKMNTTLDEAVKLAQDIVAKLGSVTDVDVAVCPPFTNLSAVSQIVKGTRSCAMLKSVGCEYVIIGHSEQRTYFHETNETVNKKVKAALQAGLKPIICVGETLEERNSGKMDGVITAQVNGAFKDISKEDALKCTVAYEPVWAIGTGVVATTQQANEAHIFIRKLLAGLYDQNTAQALIIQYGGSMKPDNAKELLAQSDVDGGLIGGAALKADSFMGIVIPK
jgi:triosephosphate isomerase